MIVRRFEDLVCWQLSHELKCEVFAFTANRPAARDFKYCDQIRDSSASAASNIAEGFGRFRPRDFARFLEIARASLMETQNHLRDGHDRRYIEDRLYWRLRNLSAKALRATTNLMLCQQARGRQK
ncbi:MAG: four helix bundle protein [Acidobacteria bacterium]|nr:four helix bundle protein [Acidobacteriota bacterium]